MILTIISAVLITTSIWTSYKDFKADKSLLKNAYFKNPIDYLFAVLIAFTVFTSLAFAYSFNLPGFLKWSWLDLLSSDNQSGGNLIMKPFASGVISFILLFWAIMTLALPYLAKGEEKAFRSSVFSQKKRIIESIKFGFIHMIVGVPVIAGFVLSIVGYIFSVWYIKGYTKAFKEGKAELADEMGIDRSTSLHAKYNFVIITFVALIGLLLAVYGK